MTDKTRAALVLGVLVVALLAVAGQRAWAWEGERQRADDSADAVAAASAELRGLIEISSSTSKDDINTLLDGATADFRSELAAQADRLRETLVKNKVTATGTVVSAGVAQLHDDSATVIVAATGTVRNRQADKPEPRNYRLRVDLTRSAGRWLVSGLEFVS